MIGAILQGLVQALGQAWQSSPQWLQNTLRSELMVVAERAETGVLQREIGEWYQSLSPEAKAKVKGVVRWAVKDALKDVAALYIGKPNAELLATISETAVDLAYPKVEKTFPTLEERRRVTKEELRPLVSNEVNTQLRALHEAS